MKIAFGIISKQIDVYARMLLISALSVKKTNPQAKILLVSEKQTLNSLNAGCNIIFNAVDEIVEVDIPCGDEKWQSRYLKTKIGIIIDGPFLFLDSDIIVRKDLSSIFTLKCDIAAAQNHSQTDFKKQLLPEHGLAIESLDWNVEGRDYLNSGVIYFAGTAAAVDFSKKWHDLWTESWIKTKSHLDQLAFNQAIGLGICSVYILPATYNSQVLVNPIDSIDSAVWHFYASNKNMEPTVFSDLLYCSKHTNLNFLKVKINKTLRNRLPWTPSTSRLLVESTVWHAYQSNIKLLPSEMLLLLRVNSNWKNALLIFCSIFYKYHEFQKIILFCSQIKKNILKFT